MTASLSGEFNFEAFTDSGDPAANHRLYTYAAGTTTHKTAYQDANASVPHVYTSDGLGGQYIALNARGELTSPLFLTSGGYDLALKTPLGATVWTRRASGVEDLAAASLVRLADSTDTANGDALTAVKRVGVTGAAATTLHDWIERQRLDAYADFGIVPDGSTDRTAALTSLLSTLGSASFRGWLRIPYNTKFTVPTVYAAVPTGVILDDESSINWGQPPTYKNRFRVMYSGDTVSDDTQQVIGSGHHPAMMLLNMGTAGSVAAANRYASILHGIGKDYDGDPLLGWLQQFAKDPSDTKWRMSLRLQTPYSVAIANPQPWVTAHVYAAGSYCISDGGKVYKTTAGGTSGGATPTGTGTAINDGGVLWDYVQAALNIDSTRFDLDEDGDMGHYGPNVVRYTQTGGARTHYIEVDGTTFDVVWRDSSRSADIWRSSTANGLRSGRIQSLSRVNTTISATGALTLQAPLHFLTASGGPWDITDLTLPTGQTSGEVTLWFAGTGMTLKNNANIVTRTGADIASAANMMITLYKDTAISGSWIVKSKN
jgi:hypothetical protein